MMEMTDDQINAYALEQLADGDLLAEIAESVGVKRTTLYMRMQKTPEMIDAYTRAREEGLLARGERLRAMTKRSLPVLANGGIDPAAVSQLKLEVETEKWTLAKLLSSVFGDKVALTGGNGGAILTELTVEYVRPNPTA
jgi:hypothetical protein